MHPTGMVGVTSTAQANPVALGRISQFLKACGALGVKQVGDPAEDAEAEIADISSSCLQVERHHVYHVYHVCGSKRL